MAARQLRALGGEGDTLPRALALLGNENWSTATKPTGDLVQPYLLPASLATSFLAKLQKRGWKGPQRVCSPATSCRANSIHAASEMLTQPDLSAF